MRLSVIKKPYLVILTPYRNFYALGFFRFFSGLRSGEMIGLKWEDIDFFRHEISIKRAIKMGVVSTPKTLNSIRDIDMIDSLLPYLESQYKITGKYKSYVFLNEHQENFYDIKRIERYSLEKGIARVWF